MQKKLRCRYSSGLWIHLWFKVNLHSKIKCIRLFCICNFQMNFFYFASLFIGFPPASVPYKPLVLLFSPHNSLEVSRKIQKVWTKNRGRSRKWYDNSWLLLNIKKGSILDVVSFLDLGFRKFQIPIPNTDKVIVFHSVLLIPDLLMLPFFLDPKQVQGCDIVCMVIVV